MKITHQAKTSVSNVTSDMASFSSAINCYAVQFDNTGSDDARIYFNDDTTNYIKVLAGDSREFSVDGENKILTDTYKITFETAVSPNIDVIKQTVTLIT